ncbi:MAG: UPF0149 family protein [Lautropia sp.]
MIPAGPLTDEEREELDRFLLEVEGVDASMDISMLDGYFAAIVSGPRTILPSEWLRWVWDTERGEEGPVYERMEQAQRIMGLLMRHMNDVASTLAEAPEAYEPLIMENPNDGDPIPVIDEWCTGFMKGVGLDATGWLPVTVGHPDWLSTVVLYGTEEGWERLERTPLSVDEHRQRAAGLGDTVRKIHALFLEQRKRETPTQKATPARRQPVRNPGKVGRNDPCPCGSGKKYKHCHGHATRLH